MKDVSSSVNLFRKKPVVIEAFQLNYNPASLPPMGTQLDWPGWFREAFFKPKDAVGSVFLHDNGLFVVYTLEGLHEITPGSWVIKGVQGEIYSCKADIFEMTYELVSDSPEVKV